MRTFLKTLGGALCFFFRGKVLLTFSKLGFYLLSFSLLATKLFALPLGFGFNQDERRYDEIAGKNFKIYHDHETPHEGAMTANALEAAKPMLEHWLKTKRHRPLPVILSAVSANASFANFISDAIELQTLAEGGRDLFWHEYSHNQMFLHFRNFFGPAGTILHLPWIPAWFIEGFAETLSVSIGSDTQASIERYQALTGSWPSYDKLHSLYSNNNFFLQGYATSGAFVSWIFKRAYDLQKNARKKSSLLPRFLKNLYRYTTPRYFPWALSPLSDFMPMDATLKDWLGEDGKTLYQRYQKEALDHWQKQPKGPFLTQTSGERLLLNSLPAFSSDGHETFMVLRDDGQRRKMRLTFSPTSPWLIGAEKTTTLLPQDSPVSLHISRSGLQIAVASDTQATTGFRKHRLILFETDSDNKGIQKRQDLLNLRQEIYALFETPQKIVWLEKDYERSRLCYLRKQHLKGKLPLSRQAVSCPLNVHLPQSLQLLGSRQKTFPAISMIPSANSDQKLHTEIWLAIKEETLVGDRYKLVVWDSATETLRRLAPLSSGKPLQMTEAGPKLWLLLGEHNRRSLQQIDNNGKCLGSFALEDYPVQISGLEDGSLVLGLYQGGRYSAFKVPAASLQTKPCHEIRNPTSPLLWAMQAKRQVTFESALEQSSLWDEHTFTSSPQKEAHALAMASGLDRASLPLGGEAVVPGKSQKAGWHPRPVLAFPWIGADDALGNQLGIVSVPLMDHMQNETLRATALWGLASRYPNTEITLQSSRFWPTAELGVYRRQVWNGQCFTSRTQAESSYMDEKGVHSQLSFPWFFHDSHLSLAVGLRAGTLKPYLGPCPIPEGRINEPYGELSFNKSLGPLSLNLGLQGKTAPASLNRQLDYDKLGLYVSTNFRLPFLLSQLSLGLEASRTRGKKRFLLEETYQPLKTFVPGSGGGYNKNSFPLLGQGSLFYIRYGDTQARLRAAWSYPLIPAWDRQIWLFYLQSLNFTAFFNYGGAWYHRPNLTLSELSSRFIKAHGYNLDLLFENKGVGFNISLGSGQVIGDPFQLYMTFGFDAFF